MTITYEDAREILLKVRKSDKKLANKTYLRAYANGVQVRVLPETVVDYFRIMLFDNRLLDIHKSVDPEKSLYILGASTSPTSARRIHDFTPFRMYKSLGRNYVSTKSGTRPHIPDAALNADGLFPDIRYEFLNTLDAQHYTRKAEMYASVAVDALVHGQLLAGWEDDTLSVFDKFSQSYRSWGVRAVMDQKYNASLLVHVLARSDEERRMLRSCHPDTYRTYWCKPRNKKEELARYELELKGLRNFPRMRDMRPANMQRELKNIAQEELLRLAYIRRD